MQTIIDIELINNYKWSFLPIDAFKLPYRLQTVHLSASKLWQIIHTIEQYADAFEEMWISAARTTTVAVAVEKHSKVCHLSRTCISLKTYQFSSINLFICEKKRTHRNLIYLCIFYRVFIWIYLIEIKEIELSKKKFHSLLCVLFVQFIFINCIFGTSRLRKDLHTYVYRF